jgi:broad specificity phosphatase PhoE
MTERAGDIHSKPSSACDTSLSTCQTVYVIRHGNRWDYESPSWSSLSYTRNGDSPLSSRGYEQAHETGVFLNQLWTSPSPSNATESFNDHSAGAPVNSNGDSSKNRLPTRPKRVHVKDITWLSSPFVRCLQTSDTALRAAVKNLDGDTSKYPQIKIENSIWEWDGKDGQWHASLPRDIVERTHYFPRIDVKHASLFTPALPEPRSEFMTRCQEMWRSFENNYPYKAGHIVVMVTHAASSIGIVSAATGLPFSEITPAAPCSVYRLTRTSDEALWLLDPHDLPGSMNGHTAHLSDADFAKTSPWNNFGNKSIKGTYGGYTGPPTSRFAPPKLLQISLQENGAGPSSATENNTD